MSCVFFVYSSFTPNSLPISSISNSFAFFVSVYRASRLGVMTSIQSLPSLCPRNQNHGNYRFNRDLIFFIFNPSPLLDIFTTGTAKKKFLQCEQHAYAFYSLSITRVFLLFTFVFRLV